MPVSRNEKWVQIAELDENDQIHFTPSYLELMSELGWEAKAFAGHLLGLWYDPFEHMLDYSSGSARFSADQPGHFECNELDKAQEVVEYWAKTWTENSNGYEPAHKAGIGLELGIDWYRDVLRAKLVSICLPERLLIAYRNAFKEKMHQIEQIIIKP